ncbi:MAG: bifunctional [glutamine synthetase] adenylyltransferase/[glutamine synthetase]-adenylyl-L-tyrosine phosphorylase, partial [Mycobacterium sp.]|nr:bifunctional [glutamine synthetase] adenylyltransferase/[glutamine synthetase]-adenylyl-L-tyrosine phosphorylase [Mycobacterium sp.]
MAKPVTERPRLPGVGRLGLVDPAAPARLTGLGWNSDVHVELLWSLSRAPDADLALQSVVRLAEALGDGWPELDTALLADRGLRGRLFALLGSSLAFGDHLAANPQAWRRLAGAVSLPTPADLRGEFSDCIAEFGTAPTVVMPKLRTLYRDQLMVLAALDLAPTVENEPVLQFSTVGAQLSDLADAALDAALQVAVGSVCKSEPAPRLAVIAMGKCGARELNYVSDVDIILVGEDADALTTRVAGEMMRLASEAFFEVDAALRPEGKAGALVRTLDSHVAYYQRWAKTWEFQALLKARMCVGDAELGRRYIDALMPMVWTACEREDFVPEVQAMRRR